MFKNTTINLSGKSTHNFFILKNFRENIKIDSQKWIQRPQLCKSVLSINIIWYIRHSVGSPGEMHS